MTFLTFFRNFSYFFTIIYQHLSLYRKFNIHGPVFCSQAPPCFTLTLGYCHLSNVHRSSPCDFSISITGSAHSAFLGAPKQSKPLFSTRQLLSRVSRSPTRAERASKDSTLGAQTAKSFAHTHTATERTRKPFFFVHSLHTHATTLSLSLEETSPATSDVLTGEMEATAQEEEEE